jgi:hypothetical protein
MSVEVPLDELPGAVAERDFAYLLTVGEDGRPRAVAVVVRAEGHELRAEVGHRTAANASARPAVSLVFPPAGTDRFSLVVDGTATVQADGATVVVTATWAVRHRPAR